MSPKVFFEFTLPNATTWSLFSLLLAVALFFKFSRLLSMRNLDADFMFSLHLPWSQNTLRLALYGYPICAGSPSPSTS